MKSFMIKSVATVVMGGIWLTVSIVGSMLFPAPLAIVAASLAMFSTTATIWGSRCQ